MSSVATQTDSFQDHLGEISEIMHIDSFQDPTYLAEAGNSEEFWKLVHIDSFQDPSQMVTFDFFQDHSEENWKLVQIDSLQDHHSGLYGNSSEIDSFKTPVIYHQIDSFQDPMFVYSTKLFKIDSFQDPSTLHGKLLSN